MKKRNRILAASAVAIMLAPAALSALPQAVDAAAVGTISTTTPVYNAAGKATGATLAAGSQWQLGQQITLNGVAHYQVATNEYVPASVVTNVTGSANPVDTSQQVGRWISTNPDAGKTVTAKTVLNIVDGYGNETGATLPSGSQWKIGAVLHANKMLYYQVGNNQYVPTIDVTIDDATNTATNDDYIMADSNKGKVATTTEAVQVYDNNGNTTGRTLAAGSQWKLGNFMKHDKVGYYQVGTNEWIEAIYLNIAASTPTDTTTSSDNYVMTDSNAGKIGTATQVLQVVDNNGKATGVTLPNGSQWKLGNFMKHDKVAYYQVATNEWVPAMNLSIAATATDSDASSDNYVMKDANYGNTAILAKAAKVYDNNGNATGYVLPSGSQWKLGNFMKHDKVAYYQVATNEWIMGADIDSINGKDNTNVSNGSYITEDATQAGQVATATADLQVVDGSGKSLGMSLPKGSQWKLGNGVLHFDKQLWLQVATNEYVPAIYLTVGDIKGITNPMDGLIGTTKDAQKTYNTATNAYGQTLPANSSWKISKLVVNKYGSYWGQISTNEWVWISKVKLNSGLNLKDNSYYEPDFATAINK